MNRQHENEHCPRKIEHSTRATNVPKNPRLQIFVRRRVSKCFAVVPNDCATAALTPSRP